MTYSKNVFCLEFIEQDDATKNSIILPWLEKLALNHNITNVYKDFDDIESFEAALQVLLYEDKNYNQYQLLYFVVTGNNNLIEINNYYYSFTEIAELFEGKLQNKIIHFANTFSLNIDEEEAQYFLDITGARGLSGYSINAPILSTALDGFYFNLCQTYEDPIALVETLFEDKYALCKTLGFTFYY